MARSVGEGNDVIRGLAQLGDRYGLDDRQREQLRRLLASLATEPQAPTTVRAASQALDVHVADSLVALQFSQVQGARRIADLGAGAGFPGLVLAIALPDGAVSLIESQARKCAFIETMIAATDVRNAAVVNLRAEDWLAGTGGQDLITARAVGPQPVVLEYAAPLLELSGHLIDWRGRRDHADETAALAAAEQLGLERVEVRAVEPFKGARDLHLHVFAKVAATPVGFPRRAGMARKRPLGR